MHQVQRNGVIFWIALAIGLPLVLTTKPSAATIVAAMFLVFALTPFIANIVDVVQERRREARRVPRAVASRRRRNR
jgi:predicted PurR-regulated permease PerM